MADAARGRLSDRLAGRAALVTGAGSGIGRGCALMFARHGARVAGIDIDIAAMRAAREDALSEGLDMVALAADLTSPDEVGRVVGEAAAALGGIDVLVNAAAVADFAWIGEMDFERQWRRTLAGELDTVFLVTRAAWPHLAAGGQGSIVNLASANAHVALRGSAAIAHTAGKGGVLAMTRQLAMEGAPLGIRANSISPGMIVTPATQPVLERPEFLSAVREKLMLGRLGVPEDIAWCAVYLASAESGYVTGADFSIDGGATAW